MLRNNNAHSNERDTGIYIRYHNPVLNRPFNASFCYFKFALHCTPWLTKSLQNELMIVFIVLFILPLLTYRWPPKSFQIMNNIFLHALSIYLMVCQIILLSFLFCKSVSCISFKNHFWIFVNWTKIQLYVHHPLYDSICALMLS